MIQSAELPEVTVTCLLALDLQLLASFPTVFLPTANFPQTNQMGKLAGIPGRKGAR